MSCFVLAELELSCRHQNHIAAGQRECRGEHRSFRVRASRVCFGGPQREIEAAPTSSRATGASSIQLKAGLAATGGVIAGASSVGAVASASTRSSSAQTGAKPCVRTAGSLAVQWVTRSHTAWGTPALQQRRQVHLFIQNADRRCAPRCRPTMGFIPVSSSKSRMPNE